MGRKEEFSTICQLSGLTEVDARSGWPGIASYESQLDHVTRLVALHAAPVAPHRTVTPDEIKVEPPGRFKPVEAPDGYVVVVVGNTRSMIAAEVKPVLVAFSGDSRVGRNERWNATFFRPFVDSAARNGWAAYTRALAGGGTETMHAFTPPLLPSYLDMIANGLETLPGELVTEAISVSGLLEGAAQGMTRTRVVQTMTKVLRNSRFGRRQRDAYGGACAMCGLTLNINQGAHVYPVETGEGSDHVSNGFYACLLHHKAFDDHLIYIDPISLEIRLHPGLVDEAMGNTANEQFVESTFTHLALPAADEDRVNAEWLVRRYGYFEGLYDWANQPNA